MTVAMVRVPFTYTTDSSGSPYVTVAMVRGPFTYTTDTSGSPCVTVAIVLTHLLLQLSTLWWCLISLRPVQTSFSLFDPM